MPEAALVFFVATIIIVIGAASSYLFRRTGIPDMLFLVMLGVAVGPVLGLIKVEDIAPFTPSLAILALVIILFDGGLSMSVHKVVAQFPRAIILAVLGFIINVVAVTLFATYFMGLQLLEGALLGSILGGSSSVVVIAIAQRLGVSEKCSTTLILESSITDVLCIVGGLVLIEVTLVGLPPLQALAQELAARFTTGIVLGIAIGLVWLSILPKLAEEQYRYMVTLAAIFLTYFASEFLGGSGAISALLFGLILANSGDILTFFRRPSIVVVDESFRRLEAEIVFLVKAFFFTYLGLIVTFSETSLVVFGFILSIVLLAARHVVVLASTVRSELANERKVMSVLYARGLAAAILSVLPAQFGLPNAEFYPSMTLPVILITAIITSIGAAKAKRPQRMPIRLTILKPLEPPRKI